VLGEQLEICSCRLVDAIADEGEFEVEDDF
jgi:hypothetical protein